MSTQRDDGHKRRCRRPQLAPTCARRKCLAEASQQDDMEKVRRQRRFTVRGSNGQRRPRSCSSLRPDESFHLCRCLIEELLPAVPLHSGASFVLPSSTHSSWFDVPPVPGGGWPSSVRHCLPGWWFETHDTDQNSSRFSFRPQERRLWMSLQTGRPSCPATVG